DVRAPAALRRTLRKVAAALPRFARTTGAGPVGLSKAGGGLYAFRAPNGRPVVFGVIGRTLVAASSGTRARAFAAAQPQPVPGVNGSLVLEADAERLARDLVKRYRPEAAGTANLFTAPLGELTGSVTSGTGGLRGRLKLG